MKIYKRVLVRLKLGFFRKEHGLKMILGQGAVENTWSQERGSDGKQKLRQLEVLYMVRLTILLRWSNEGGVMDEACGIRG